MASIKSLDEDPWSLTVWLSWQKPERNLTGTGYLTCRMAAKWSKASTLL